MPRSFLGPLFLSILSSPVVFLSSVLDAPKFYTQLTGKLQRSHLLATLLQLMCCWRPACSPSLSRSLRRRGTLAHARGGEEAVWLYGRRAVLSDMCFTVSPHVLQHQNSSECFCIANRWEVSEFFRIIQRFWILLIFVFIWGFSAQFCSHSHLGWLRNTAGSSASLLWLSSCSDRSSASSWVSCCWCHYWAGNWEWASCSTMLFLLASLHWVSCECSISRT